MPTNEPAGGFRPIEVSVGAQNPPAVSEVDFTPVSPPVPAPREAAPRGSKKED